VDQARRIGRAAMIGPLLNSKDIVVCVGPGGVGKTTTAAALAALAARQGRRTLVSTIDPAPRLADALGVGRLSGEPQPVSPEACRTLGVAQDGLLWAVRLDTQRAFASLVEEQVSDPEMRRRIFANGIYRQITSTLSGSQEYAATLALYDLNRQKKFDLIVLDTPPTANALEFLEAPRRIADAVSSPALQWFARPPEKMGRFSLQRLRSGGAMVIRRLGKFVGSQFLDDIGAFLVDFNQVLGGFQVRAQQIDQLLRGERVSFLLVLAPELPAIEEALYFHNRLRAAGLPLGGFIANRVHPAPGLTDARTLAERLAAQPGLAGWPRADIDRAADRLAGEAARAQALCQAERKELGRLAREAPGVGVTEIPLLDHDIENLAELRVIGDTLAGPANATTAAGLV
jgi:anion-transporting  ArsA/GET3 family ATPase